LDLSGTLQGAGGVGGLLYSFGGTTSVSSVFYTHDGSGNVTDLLDLTAAISNGNAVVARHDYDPFGELLRASGPAAAANPWRFSTRYTDTETGLVMYPKRPYSPILGRWLSRDRIGEKGGPNLYAFVGNQPVNQIDPLGTDAFVAYRRLGIKGLGWTHRVTGHVYLAFNNDNMDGNPGWQQVLQELGYSRQDWHTFSFHPDSVRTGTSAGNKVLVLYTGTSWVDPNNIDADIRPIRDGAAQLILLTKDPCEQVALFRAAHKSYLANQGGNNDRGYYSFMINNCASWAKGIVEGAGLEWPTSARFLNGGTAVGGPMDYTLLPQATYVLAVAGYEGGQAIGVVARGTVSGAQAVAEGAQATVTWVVNNGEWATAPINEGTDNESVGIGVRFSF
jgi:RHS repeat-associated protein